jgi:hypothetical protein
MITNLNFDEIFDTSRLFEKTQKTDLDILTKSISELDTAFNSLLSNFLLVPIKESEEIAKDTERNIENDYNKFFSNFKTTIKIMIDFFNKYEANGTYSDNGFSDFLKNTFNSSKDAYDAITTKINSTTTVNTDKKIKFLNDAYFAYVYLLRCFNSIIENYNSKHVSSQLKQIEGVPEPTKIENLNDHNLKSFIETYLNDLKILSNKD